MQDTFLGIFITDYLPWIMSAITIHMTLLAGNKSKNAWVIGLCNQALWLVWIGTTGAWGLLPMNLALWFLYIRNHWKWNDSPEIRRRRPIHPDVAAAHAQFGGDLEEMQARYDDYVTMRAPQERNQG